MTEVKHVFVLCTKGQYDDHPYMEGIYRKIADAQAFAEMDAGHELEWHEASWSKDGEYVSAVDQQEETHYRITKEPLR